MSIPGKGFLLPLFTMALLCAGMLAVKLVAADSWSWVAGVPVVEQKTSIEPGQPWTDHCQIQYLTMPLSVEIQGTDSTTARTECIVGAGDNYKLFMYGTNKNLAIHFAGDTAAHAIRGIECGVTCLYMPSRDTFIRIES